MTTIDEFVTERLTQGMATSAEIDVMLKEPKKLAIDDFLAHYGVKGMRWGVRRDDSEKSFDSTTKALVKEVKSAKTVAQMESILGKAKQAGQLEDHLKVQNVTPHPDGKKVKYELRAFRSGNRSEDIVKDVAVKRGIVFDPLRSKTSQLMQLGAGAFDLYSTQVVNAQIAHEDEWSIDGFLAHYGIKGMKWGIRRERGPGGTVSSNPDVRKTVEVSSPRKLSDQDLQAAVQRMRLEREFRQLKESERPSKGESFTKNMLKEIGKKQVKRVANTAADIAVEQAIAQLGSKTKSPGVSEIATRMKPKKKK